MARPFTLEEMDTLTDQRINLARESREFAARHEGHNPRHHTEMESSYSNDKSPSRPLFSSPDRQELQKQQLAIDRKFRQPTAYRQWMNKQEGYGVVNEFDVEMESVDDTETTSTDAQLDTASLAEREFQERHKRRRDQCEDENDNKSTPRGQAGCLGITQGLLNLFACGTSHSYETVRSKTPDSSSNSPASVKSDVDKDRERERENQWQETGFIDHMSEAHRSTTSAPT